MEKTEKFTPSFELDTIKDTFANIESLAMSSMVLRILTAFGLSLEDLVRLIQSLTPHHFVKSIRTNDDEELWQDVYSTNFDCFLLKFQKTETGHFIICL